MVPLGTTPETLARVVEMGALGPVRSRALPRTLTEQRIAAIVDLMTSLRYHAGLTPDALAQEWGLTPNTVRGLTAEAHRIVRAAVCDPDQVAQDIGARLQTIMAEGSDRDAILAGRVWAEVAGALAPKQVEIRHETTMSEAELRERLGQLAARARELAAVPAAELVAGPEA